MPHQAGPPHSTSAGQTASSGNGSVPSSPVHLSGIIHADAPAPFTIDDLLVFDDDALHHLFGGEQCRFDLVELAIALRGASPDLVSRLRPQLPPERRLLFDGALERPRTEDQTRRARKHLLDELFWDLTYWKTPHLYSELADGEEFHPGIFRNLAAIIYGSDIADIAAGGGRATFQALRMGAKHVWAIEPSPGLRRIISLKAVAYAATPALTLLPGYFDALPLPDNSVDVTLSCSAFTSGTGQGGEAGLVEMQRVTRPGGWIVLIWPRPEDYAWLAVRGFQRLTLPVQTPLRLRFRSMAMALRLARYFYPANTRILTYLNRHQRPEVPYSLVGNNPPHVFCLRQVVKPASS